MTYLKDTDNNNFVSENETFENFLTSEYYKSILKTSARYE